MIGTVLLLQALVTPAVDWRQEVAYRISAVLDEPAGAIRGHAVVTYRNRSRDTLTAVSFHLESNRIRNVLVGEAAAETIWPFAPDSSVLRLGLPLPLPPDDSVTIRLDWESTLPQPTGARGRHFDLGFRGCSSAGRAGTLVGHGQRSIPNQHGIEARINREQPPKERGVGVRRRGPADDFGAWSKEPD